MRIVNFRHPWTILSIVKVCRERKSKNEYTIILKQFTPHRATAILLFFFFFFLFKVLFVFFFGDNHSPTLNSRTKRRERNSDRNDIQCLFFSFFRLLMAFDLLPCNFTLEAVSFGSMLIQHYEHLQIAIEIHWVMFHGYVYDVLLNYWRQLEEINWKCSTLLSILWFSVWIIMKYFIRAK